MRLAELTEEIVGRLAPGGAIVVGNSTGDFSPHGWRSAGPSW
jgi:hypothetical protein